MENSGLHPLAGTIPAGAGAGAGAGASAGAVTNVVASAGAGESVGACEYAGHFSFPFLEVHVKLVVIVLVLMANCVPSSPTK